MEMTGREILIVDDAPDIRLLVRKVLEGEGAQVTEAATIDSGLEAAKKKVPHLIILDLELPEKSGFDFLTEIQNTPAIAAIPVIILSGRNDKQAVIRAIALGAHGYLLKPFRATLLLQKIRKTLRLQSFQTRKLPEGTSAALTISADLTHLSEVGCRIEAGVRLAPGAQVDLESSFLTSNGAVGIAFKASRRTSVYAGPNRYTSEIDFVGLDLEKVKKLRLYLRRPT
jgi:DNA-binding response OmpR family regulator